MFYLYIFKSNNILYYFQLSVVETKNLLSVLKQICENHYNDFDVELINSLVQFATNEMIKSSDSQFPASDILVTLGRGRSDQVKYIFHLKYKYLLFYLLYLSFSVYNKNISIRTYLIFYFTSTDNEITIFILY